MMPSRYPRAHKPDYLRAPIREEMHVPQVY